VEDISGSGKGGSPSSDGFMLFATGTATDNFCGLLEYLWAAIIGLSWAMFVPGEFA
jgi:hypothetical protein